jgi:hypothetical protein
VVEESLDAAIEIVNNKLHALKSKTEKEIIDTSDRIIKVTRLVLDARLHLERLMLVDDPDPDPEEKHDESEGDEQKDPDLFTSRQTRVG